jgi:hypothetical protein
VSEENEDINSEPEICEVFTYDEEKVERLKKEVAVTEGLSTFFKALADDTRLKVIHALSQDELCVRNMELTEKQVASENKGFLEVTGE